MMMSYSKNQLTRKAVLANVETNPLAPTLDRPYHFGVQRKMSCSGEPLQDI